MYLLFDIGGTKIRLTTSDGKTINSPQVSPTPINYQDGLKIFRNFIKDKKVTAVSGGIPGPLDHQKTKLEDSPQLPNWINKPLKIDLSKIIKAPVFLENDAALAGLGEAIRGGGKGYSVVAYLTVSTGVGGAKIVDGRIDKNVHGFEPGQMMVKDGKLGQFVSGMALEKKYKMKPEQIKDPKIWGKVAKVLAEGINNLILDWSPNVVVLGGSIMKSIDIKKVEKYLRSDLTIYKDIPSLKLASLENLSGLYGALEYLKQML